MDQLPRVLGSRRQLVAEASSRNISAQVEVGCPKRWPSRPPRGATETSLYLALCAPVAANGSVWPLWEGSLFYLGLCPDPFRRSTFLPRSGSNAPCGARAQAAPGALLDLCVRIAHRFPILVGPLLLCVFGPTEPTHRISSSWGTNAILDGAVGAPRACTILTSSGSCARCLWLTDCLAAPGLRPETISYLHQHPIHQLWELPTSTQASAVDELAHLVASQGQMPTRKPQHSRTTVREAAPETQQCFRMTPEPLLEAKSWNSHTRPLI